MKPSTRSSAKAEVLLSPITMFTSLNILKTISRGTSATDQLQQNKLIDDPLLWFNFIEFRNKSSHSYNEDIAQVVFQAAKDFIPHAEELIKRLKK